MQRQYKMQVKHQAEARRVKMLLDMFSASLELNVVCYATDAVLSLCASPWAYTTTIACLGPRNNNKTYVGAEKLPQNAN